MTPFSFLTATEIRFGRGTADGAAQAAAGMGARALLVHGATAARADWLTRAMTALPEDLRDTLALVLDDMTHAEAATVLGVSEGTISWRVSEAKKRLRAIKQSEETA